jgi:hypothetical protein
VPDFNGVHVGEVPPAVVEEQLPLAVDQHLHGPKDGRATGNMQYDIVGLLPIDH